MIDPYHTRAYFNVLRGPSKMSTAGLNPSLQSTRFPPAAVLVVKPIRDGFLLIRLTDDGSFAGDTWSADWDEVREEVAENYADVIGEWCDIPEGTEDVESYVNRVRSVEEGPLHDRDRRRGRTPCFSVEHELVAAFHPEDFAIVEEMSFRRDDPREL